MDRYVQGERDHRSHAVADYDTYQEGAKDRHAEQLKDVVGRKY